MFTIRPCGLAAAARCVALTVALFAAASAHAIPITYLFKGLASGTYISPADPDAGPVDFGPRNLTVTIATDTDNINAVRYGATSPATEILVDALISISGLGSGSFLNPVYVSNNHLVEGVGFGNEIQHDLIDLVNDNAGLDTYDMKSDFGPITGTPVAFNFQFIDVPTTLGLLTVSELTDLTFEATTGPVAPVPEPETWALMALGLGLMAAYGSRRKKSAS